MTLKVSTYFQSSPLYDLILLKNKFKTEPFQIIMRPLKYKEKLIDKLNSTTEDKTILIPNLFALLTSISAYIIIGLTSPFNSISVYCSFICRLKR